MELTFTVASATGADVFAVFEQDSDAVVRCINFLIERGKKKTKTEPAKPKQQKDDFWKFV